MYMTLLGQEGFRKGMELYIERHDGQAVTCEDFYAAMMDANNTSLPGLLRWYFQAGIYQQIELCKSCSSLCFLVTRNAQSPHRDSV